MSIEETFNMRNAELQQRVISEIEKVRDGQSKKSMIQLQTILEELQSSSKVKKVNLCYTRFIVDSFQKSILLLVLIPENAYTIFGRQYRIFRTPWNRWFHGEK